MRESRVLRAACVLPAIVAGISVLAPAPAQALTRITSVAGKVLAIPRGARDGVEVGLAGKVMFGDVQSERIPIAVFRVTSVKESTCEAELIEVGAGFEIEPGMEILFDKLLSRPSPLPAATPGRAPTGAAESAWDPSPYLAKATAEMQDGKLDQAEKLFRKVLGKQPANEVANQGLEQLQARRKALADVAARAKALGDRKKALGPEKFQSAESQFMLAEQALGEGKISEAEEHFKQVLAIDPDFPDVQDRLKRLQPVPGAKRQFPPADDEYVFLGSGTFLMGCVPGDHDCSTVEVPRHRVTISHGFWVAVTLTSVRSYANFAKQTRRDMPRKPSFSETDDHPIVNVSWNDAAAFCRWAGGRLLTEAEWEYAARGGNEGWEYPWGKDFSHDFANSSGTGGKDIWEGTSPTRAFPPNQYGLFDMAGNAGEWVADWFDRTYYGKSPTENPTGPQNLTSEDLRVLRGGSWLKDATGLRTSSRNKDLPSVRSVDYSFRCARDASP